MSGNAGAMVRYSLFSRSVHWLTVVLMIGMVYTGFVGFAGAPPVGAESPAGSVPAAPMAMRALPAGPATAPQAGDPTDRARAFDLVPLHKAMGVTILLLTIARLVYRAVCKVPALPANLPVWQARAARGVQGLIYLGLLVQPVTGWTFSSTMLGRGFTYFGLFTVPPVPLERSITPALRFLHIYGAWALLGLIALHALGALYHHYFRKDDVLLGMLRG